MRTAFIQSLIELARSNERIFLLVGDLGYSVVEPFAQEFPDRFINLGVADQNMTGIATGLALCGKIVFTYPIANFPTLRCLEQIRNDVCYHRAIMRALPNMTVVAPGDPVETALATQALVRWPVVHQIPPDLQIGKAITVREGSDITLITIGAMLYNTTQAAEQLVQQGIQARVLSMHTLKPLDTEAVLAAAQETRGITTVEEHSLIGGLGSTIAEALTKMGCGGAPLRMLGLPDAFFKEIGGQEYLRHVSGLSIQGIHSGTAQFCTSLKGGSGRVH